MGFRVEHALFALWSGRRGELGGGGEPRGGGEQAKWVECMGGGRRETEGLEEGVEGAGGVGSPPELRRPLPEDVEGRERGEIKGEEEGRPEGRKLNQAGEML